jgi:mono/diheme cytochrome c family protein
MQKMNRANRTLDRWKTAAFGGILLFALSAPATAIADEEPTLTPEQHKAIVDEYIACAGCHKKNGRGGPGYGGYAANFHTTELTREEIVEVITEGRRDRGMPFFKGILTDNQIQLMATYIVTEFKGKPIVDEKEK